MTIKKAALSRRIVQNLAAVTACAITFRVSAATNYTITALTGFSNLTATGLNNNDQVVGYYTSGSSTFPFVYTPGSGYTTVGGVGGGDTSAGTISQAAAINNAGLVVGTDGSNGKGFVYNISTGVTAEVSPVAAGTLGFRGINSNGVAVGTSTVSNGTVHAVTYDTGTSTIADFGGGYSGATGSTYGFGISDTGTALAMGISSANAASLGSSSYYQPFIATQSSGGTFAYTNVGTAVEAVYHHPSTYNDYQTVPGPSIDSLGNVAGTVGYSSSNTFGGTNYPNSPSGFFYNGSSGAVKLNYLSNDEGIADIAGSPTILGTYYSLDYLGFRGYYAYTYNANASSGAYAPVVASSMYLTDALAGNSRGDLLVKSSSSYYLLTVVNTSVTWTGAVSSSWDSSTANFNSSAGSPQTNKYADGYNVIFDDSATGSTSINIASAITPSNVTFQNSNKSYSISGASIQGGPNFVFNVGGGGIVTLNNTNTYTGPTNVSSGTLILSPTGSIISANVNVLAGGKLLVQNPDGLAASHQYSNGAYYSLNLNVQGIVQLANFNSSGPLVVRFNTLSIGGTANNWTGKFDIANNDLLLPYNPASIVPIINQLKSGYNNGNWNGSGISSSVAASDTSHLTAIGAIVNTSDQVRNSPAIYQSFHGTTISINDVLVGYTYYGDANLDGQVDGSDYSLIDYAFLNNTNTSKTPLTGWFYGDFNYDGVIDGSDYTLIDNAFNAQGPNAGGGENANNYVEIASELSSQSPTSSVPEPVSLTSLGFLSLGLLGRAKRRVSCSLNR